MCKFKPIIAIFISTTFLFCPWSIQAAVFPTSTEMQIGKVKNIIDKAPPGILLTIGGDRAFREASFYDKIQYLMIIDNSPEIIRFNKINAELLKADNKELYLYLRWKSFFKDWQKISDKLTQKDFDWWDANVRYIDNSKGYSIPEDLNRYGSNLYVARYLNLHRKLMLIYPNVENKYNRNIKDFLENVSWPEIEKYKENSENKTDYISKNEFDDFDKERKNEKSCVSIMINDPKQAVDIGQVIDYRSGNYLFDDVLYNRLHQLAEQGKIEFIQADLTKETDLEKITQRVKALNLNLSVLDLDNLYKYIYMGEEKFRKALSQLSLLGTKDSILVLMHNYKNFACAQFSIYFGFTFENIANWPKEIFLDHWIENLPPEIYPLLDGRLYENNDQLPKVSGAKI